ncbi:TlpA family protein disulfide reductase, partial [Streptomyces sp. SID5914]|nr:TlpA family protein disulfide reductase [Streptomyces sp. SID5914]
MSAASRAPLRSNRTNRTADRTADARVRVRG